MNQPLNLAVRRYLLRKNLISFPFELIGAMAALAAAKELAPALLYYCAGFLAGGAIGRRIAQASSLLDSFTAKEIKDFQISLPLLTNLILLLIPSSIAVALWRAEFAPNQIVAWVGLALSITMLAYRYLAFVKERRVSQRNTGPVEVGG